MTVHSTFTGLIAYSANLLLDPDPIERARAFSWYERVIEYTAWCGASATGGHLGSLSVTDVASADHALARWSELAESLDRLRRVARARGLETLLVENMACAREPSTRAQMASLVRPGNDDRVSVTLCLDIGHQCVPGTEGDERDPYVWLRELGTARRSSTSSRPTPRATITGRSPSATTRSAGSSPRACSRRSATRGLNSSSR